MEKTAFDDVNAWQAQVSQKPPLMGTYNVAGAGVAETTPDGNLERGRCSCHRKRPLWEPITWQVQVSQKPPLRGSYNVAGVSAGTVSKTIFHDVKTWQAQVSQKAPLMGTYNVAGPGVAETTPYGNL